jgi:hypothetical protein
MVLLASLRYAFFYRGLEGFAQRHKNILSDVGAKEKQSVSKQT